MAARSASVFSGKAAAMLSRDCPAIVENEQRALEATYAALVQELEKVK